eukprot:gene4081-4754_t
MTDNNNTDETFGNSIGLEDALFLTPYIDTILGTIYGNALGDAYGLATEFMSKESVALKTDDTDQMILIMQMLNETRGNVNLSSVARKLRQWIESGFPELGDVAGMGLGQTVGAVVFSEDFIEDPIACSEAVWLKSQRKGAANGAVMRTSILGCTRFNSPEIVSKNSQLLAQLTHYDPRCIVSCTTTTHVIAALIRRRFNGDASPVTDEQIESLIDDAVKDAQRVLDTLTYTTEEERTGAYNELKRHVGMRKLSELDLSHAESIGYTYKCMGSGVWGIRQSTDFRTTLDLLIREAGDADTNGAVAGAMIGARIGYSALPADMLAAMPNKKWLDKIS